MLAGIIAVQSAILLLIFLFLSFPSWAAIKSANLRPLTLDSVALEKDLGLIEQVAKFPPGTLKVSVLEAPDMKVRIICEKKKYHLKVSAPVGEKASTLYKGLREIGFFFPHPVRQISPTLASLKSHCGREIKWKPALRYRGFHLHTLHPLEWVHGFFMNKPHISEALVRWLARNGQNLLDLNLLDVPLSEIKRQFAAPFALARSLEVHTGVSFGIALNQQNSFKILSIWDSYFGWNTDQKIEKGLEDVFSALPLSFIVLEPGTSEFTPTNYKKTLRWLNHSAYVTNRHGIALMTKVHVSTNQVDAEMGNFNFIPQYATDTVGIMPHTVMFYGLLDEKAAMYGNQSFAGIRNFIVQEKFKRPTWYYPETSYWVGMDVDVPLLLTDYLATRAEDFKWLYDGEIEGHLNFTSGHALGGWLWDWNLSLINDLDYKFDPMAGLKFLDESPEVWEKIIQYQRTWFKQKGLIALISSSNLQDELSSVHRIHERFTMNDLKGNLAQVKKEIELLRESLLAWPDISGVKNEELRKMLHITKLRQLHAVEIRKALFETAKKDIYFKNATAIRKEAKALIKELSLLATNYPELPLFKQHENPTAYKFGYVYPAAITYFWDREERQITEDDYWPFSGNMYNVWDIIF